MHNEHALFTRTLVKQTCWVEGQAVRRDARGGEVRQHHQAHPEPLRGRYFLRVSTAIPHQYVDLICVNPGHL